MKALPAILISVMFISPFLYAQDQQGTITYEYISGSATRLLDMWFTSSTYLYQYRTAGDARDLPPFKNKKFSNAEDSIKFNKAIDQASKEIRKMPVQRWFGQLGNDEVIYSSFDNNRNSYCVRDTLQFAEWEITEDTMLVRGMHCQKANGRLNGKTYTAWFAPAIPIAVAPFQFRGLPGLLVQVTNNSNKVTVGMVGLEWPSKNEVEIKPCSGAPFISKREMETIISTQNSNLLKMAEEFKQELQKKGKIFKGSF
jgi:GLPGLI family protein